MLRAATWLPTCPPILSHLRKTKGNVQKPWMWSVATAFHVVGGCHCFGRKFCRKFPSKTSCLLISFLFTFIITIICTYHFSIVTWNCKHFIITCSYVHYDSVSEIICRCFSQRICNKNSQLLCAYLTKFFSL